MPKKQIIKPAKAAPAVGPYNHAVRVGDLLFCAGQIPLDPATGNLVSGDIKAQTERVLENIKIILEDQKLKFGNVVKTTVFLTNLADFADLNEGFRGVNWALLVGSVPRKQGMERKDLLGINGKIFIGQGQAIQKNAASDVRVLVVGNPCNTNCFIAMNNAPSIPRERFFAMTSL